MSFFDFIGGLKTVIRRLEDIKIESDRDRLILLMKKLNLKQYELAKQLGYNRVYVESIVNGRSPITESFLHRLNEYLENREERGSE